MKRLITASVLMLAVLLLCVAESRYTEDRFKEIKNTVQTVRNDHLNGKEINEDTFNHIANKWKENSKILSIFINRDKLTDVSEKISGLSVAYRSDDYEFISSIDEILFILDDIEKTEKINIFGIL